MIFFHFTILCECIAYHLDIAHVASAGHFGQGQLMDQARDLGDDFKFDQDQGFQASSHHNYKMIKASVMSGLGGKHNLQRGLTIM